MTRPGIEPRSPGPLANTLPTWPMSGYCSNDAFSTKVMVHSSDGSQTSSTLSVESYDEIY